MNRHVLLKEGIPTLLVVVVLSAILFFIYPLLIILGLGLLAFVLYFFRDPVREISEQEEIILSPADGLITDITEVDEGLFIKDKVTLISIFMSPLDVHVNRSPIAGKVSFLEYKKGKFIPATRQESHIVNEKNYIGIENEKTKILIVQVAGIMARRIVHWLNVGQKVGKGDKIGMIKFSSGTQVYLPKNIEVTVKKGDKLKAGTTIIGRYSE